MNSIFHRTSVRNFSNRPVEQEKIKKMLRAAMAAPSAGNQQPWEFYVVTEEKKLEQLSQSSPYAGSTKEAPVAIVACYRKKIKFPEYAQIDLSASVENLLLEADELGLGAVVENCNEVTENSCQRNGTCKLYGMKSDFAGIIFFSDINSQKFSRYSLKSLYVFDNVQFFE